MALRCVAVAAIFVAVAAAACTRTSDGVPAAEPGVQQTSTEERTPMPSGQPSDDPAAPGVVPTPSSPAAAGPICVPASLPPVRTVAQVADPAAPTATVAVPDGWSMSGGGGDIGAQLAGPSGMQAVVTITPADSDAEAAFRQYADELTADKAITTLSMLPGEMCGLSGQTLQGILSDGAETVQYRDRIVHVPTGDRYYLIAVHVTAPSGASGFDDSAAVLTEDFEIGLP